MDNGLSPGDVEDKFSPDDSGETWGHLMADDDSKPFHDNNHDSEKRTTLPKNRAVLKRLLDARRIIRMLLLSKGVVNLSVKE